MSSPVPHPTRRHLVAWGLGGAALALVGGCSRLTDPVVHGTNTLSPAPMPSPEPVMVEAAQQVVAHRAAVATHPSGAWRSGVEAMLAAHLRALTSPNPLGNDPSASPWFTTTPRAATPIATSARELLAGHVARLQAAEPGPMAMLWASLASASACAERARTGRGSVATTLPRGGGHPREITLGTPVETLNVVLAHQHKLAQLLELGLGVATNDQQLVLARRLDEVRRLVVAQQQRVQALNGDPVAPQAGYHWPGPTSTLAEITWVWSRVESDLLNAWVPAVGAAAQQQRQPLAVDLQAQAGIVQGRGGAIGTFPGWM